MAWQGVLQVSLHSWVCACVQRVLQEDGTTTEELMKSGSEFERWIKLGLNSANESLDTNAEG